MSLLNQLNHSLTTKGAQNPAMTTDAAWAGALVQEGFGAFMDLIRSEFSSC